MRKVRVMILVSVVISVFWVQKVKAEECDSPGSLSDPAIISGCISKYNGFLEAISKANTTNKQELDRLRSQITNLKSQINTLEGQLAKLEKGIFEREVKIGVKQELLSAKIRRDYIMRRDQPVLLLLFAADSAADFFKDLAFREKLANADRGVIAAVSEEVADLASRSAQLKTQKSNLAALKTKVDKQAGFLTSEVEKASKYEANLASNIAALNARQNEILAAKSGNFIASVGDSELSDDYNASIKGFRESAPGGSFAVFSFGAYTHRKGMSQYGAKGRAQAGQNSSQILQAYYKTTPVVRDTGGTIKVSGYGNLDFENYYLLGIAEMPSSFPKEALKAQAIAARSYAYRYKTSGKTICTDEGCQVFSRSKANNPPSEWRQAVQETRGQVVDGVITYFSSTTGGYITTSGWDTTDGSGGGGFFDKTYEKLGGSPWAYKAWYRSGYSANGDSCGRANPWLTSEELADIVNAALVITRGNSGETSRITPVTTSCWGGNPYSREELRNVASKYGGISSVSSVSVMQGNGETTQVTINGISFSGRDFAEAFNLRASGRLRIPQNGYAFFNIERK
jgi:peptidoglycan hydrolase CwlO-like protein